ncbi:N-acetylmuramoyl-L-alanine amidase [Bacillus safensis]|uniref:N-acetylmuramoyl-L-alanine amidase n=1 Tax=Bacillus TaxID=1386 RepID=UPI00045D2166|nr:MULTISPECIES: N-acetylmuramoyl-L-alanine amidase [Bacillus]MBY0191377.1 N-acetylmuramoyl-L-alanine amidase [Bacillus aerophilus]ARD57714.1 N-acetylmuramoyl-L-alanine amidase [Bacillus safensis]AWI38363.1 N-acetylmuramoyl-L-alanine amidase [Bacillus safensis FO-36b]KDE28311.1 N-acetylmuramoyl-L-alanine amidase [Bacillus safensis FO-36b]KIL24353.1 N-acetylmuramoyl-L-alanine amidase [Bacillus safensis]
MRSLMKTAILSLIAIFVIVPTALADNSVSRIDGGSRYAVAANVAKKGWGTASTVVLVGKTAYADATAGIPLAYQKNGPVLYTNSKSLSGDTKKALTSLKTKTVIVLGSTSSVSNNVVNQVKKMGISTQRISGKNRYELSANIAKKMKKPAGVVVVEGSFYAHGIAIAPVAAQKGFPILYTDKKGLRSEIASVAKASNVKQTIVVGGENYVTKAAYNQLKSPTRIKGSTRYDVAANIVKKYNMSVNNTYVGRGFGYATSSSAAGIAAKQNKALLLTNEKTLPKVTRATVSSKKITKFTVVGSTNTVTPTVVNQLKNPAVGKKVFIDPGHGAHDSGAVGYGLYEKNLNLDVAKRLNTKLNNAGALVTMSRTSDTFDSLQTRVSKGASANADIFISVHANSNDNSSANGTETYYDKTYAAANSLKLAQNIQPKMVSALGTRDRGVKTAGFYVIKYSKMPSVLLETGFVSSPVDSNILKSATYKDRLASGISSGVSGYFR